MGVVLVVEPNSSQAEALLPVLHRRVQAELMLVTSAGAAIDAIDRAMPDLILLSTLLSPRDEDRLMAHLRLVGAASHVQTLTIPQLSAGAAPVEDKKTFGRFRKKKQPAAVRIGCDPKVFADEIVAHLARASEARSQAVALDGAPVQALPVQTLPARVIEDAIHREALFVSEEIVFKEEVVAETETEETVLELDGGLERIARQLGLDPVMLQVAEADAPPAMSWPARPREKTEDDKPEKDDSAERLAAEVALVQAEAEATLALELERVRAEAEEHRLAELARLQVEAATMREAAIADARAEARAAAEREARETLTVELARVRAETEEAFAANLAHVQEEASQARAMVDHLAQRRVEVEEAAAAELARVRAEAEADLNVELERIRQEAEHARLADQSQAKQATEQIRETATREARAIAEAAAHRTLEAEIARVRLQADSILESELAKTRADAQERQAIELEQLRAQMAEMREVAAEQARAAAAEAIAAEVARSVIPPETMAKAKARLEREDAVDYYSLWQSRPMPVEQKGSGSPFPSDSAKRAPGPLFPRPNVPRWIKWSLPTAACLLLMANTGIAISTVARLVAPSPKRVEAAKVVVEPVRPTVREQTIGGLKVESTPLGARLLIDGRSYGATPLTIPDLPPGPHTLTLQSSAGTVARRITIRAGQTTIVSEAIFSGWLAIFSPIPLQISLNGKPATPTDDGRIMTAPGSYQVELVNERFNYRDTETLVVRPGDVTAHTVSIPSGTLHVAAPDGAEIRVDGNGVGRTPLADIPISIGTHEVTAAHPDLGDRNATVDVRYGEITEAKLN